jgi:hypothetical protein
LALVVSLEGIVVGLSRVTPTQLSGSRTGASLRKWRVIELIEKDHGGYEVRKLPYGEVCIWYPDHFVLECECGGLLLYPSSASLCRCGTDHSDLVRDLFDNQTGAGSYPWYEGRSLLPEEGPFSLG